MRLRPGFPRAERKLRDAGPETQIDRRAWSTRSGHSRATVVNMGTRTALASDAIFGLLMPLWQVLIGVLVLVVLVVSVHRLVQRGPSRMGGAMLLVGGAVVCVAVVSYLVQQI